MAQEHIVHVDPISEVPTQTVASILEVPELSIPSLGIFLFTLFSSFLC